MKTLISHALSLSVVFGMAGAAMAQDESTNRVAANTDWNVFVEDNPQECWAVSAPTETVNTRDGNVVAVRRGDILLMVFYRPDSGANGQVAFTGGYPFADGSSVTMEIGANTYELFTDGEWAWATNNEMDAAIVAAMKRGADAVLTARSTRGTVTKDTFSLLGFTASVDDAAARCN